MTALLLSDGSRAEPTPREPVDVVSWFGAMQAQDYASGLWSVGVRTHGSLDQVSRSLADYQIVRTWPMRGTIHLVAAADVRWMLAATGTLALKRVAARWATLGLDADTVERAIRVFHERLAGAGPVPRREALAALESVGIDTSGQRGYHLIWYASQIGETCLGPNVDGQPTVVLLEEAVPRTVDRTPDDPLAELAGIYVRSHGPVTHSDFARWAGITATQARRALSDQEHVTPIPPDETVGDGPPLWRSVDAATEPIPAALALPGFDEFILGYKDRSLFLDPCYADRIVPGGNGVFRPTIVLSGRVRATWHRTGRAATDRITVTPFADFSAAEVTTVEGALQRYSQFTGRPVQVSIA